MGLETFVCRLGRALCNHIARLHFTYLLDQCPIHDRYMKKLMLSFLKPPAIESHVADRVRLGPCAFGHRGCWSSVEAADERSEAQNPASNNQPLYSATIKSFIKWIRNVQPQKSGEPGTSGKIQTPLVR